MLALRDIASDGFRRALHGFSRYLQTSQQLDLTASVVEGHFGTSQRQHAAHARRQLQPLNVQRGIGGELSVMALRTQIPGAQEPDLAHNGQHVP